MTHKAIYVKLLLITITIHIIGFALAYSVDHLLEYSGMIPVVIISISIFASMITTIFLALRWCHRTHTAFALCVLLPTNYTIFLLLILVVHFTSNIVEILGNMPPNFG